MHGAAACTRACVSARPARLLQQAHRQLAKHRQVVVNQRQRLADAAVGERRGLARVDLAVVVIARQRRRTSAAVRRPNRSRMQRERTVGSNAPGTAVVRMNIVPGGGSSSDLSSEFCDGGLQRVGFADQHHAPAAFEWPIAVFG